MEKLRNLFKMALLISTTTLSAHNHPSPGHMALSADFLYALPSVDDTYFVIVSTEAPRGDGLPPGGVKENNDWGFNPGFRVGGVYAFSEYDNTFEIYYSRLSAETTKVVSGEFLTSTLGVIAIGIPTSAGTASSDLDLLYQRVDGIFTQQAYCYCGLDIDLLFGLEYAYIRLNEDYLYTQTGGVATLSSTAKTWGVGPELGVTFDYALCSFSWCECPSVLSITGATSGSILASKTQTDVFLAVSGLITIPMDEESSWRMIPVWHTRVGLNYSSNFFCCGASLEVGYEFNSYLRGLRRETVPITGGLSFPQYDNFDLQGLYISAAFTF